MAQLVNAIIVPCPSGCGAWALVQIWSCGCQTVTFSTAHTKRCLSSSFEELNLACSDKKGTGPIQEH